MKVTTTMTTMLRASALAIPRLGAAVLVSTLLVACSREPRKASPEPAPTPQAAKPPPAAPVPPASGAAGAGDGSGRAVAHARALRVGAPVTLEIPCSGQTYFGPFVFTRDPERVTVHAKTKSVRGEQVCVPGHWVNGGGAEIAVAGLPCADGEHALDSEIVMDHSPGNGGDGTNPVYLKLGFQEPQPKGCPTVTVTLRTGG